MALQDGFLAFIVASYIVLHLFQFFMKQERTDAADW